MRGMIKCGVHLATEPIGFRIFMQHFVSIVGRMAFETKSDQQNVEVNDGG